MMKLCVRAVRSEVCKVIKYYGGKKWLSKFIKKYLPNCKKEFFVDLFVGGGSISDCLCQEFTTTIINDKDNNLMNFYRCVKEYNIDDLVRFFEEQREKTDFDNVKEFRKRLENDNLTNLERAFLYYSCVYCGYGGKPYASPTRDKFNQYKKRNIHKDLSLCKKTLSYCELHCEDYHNIKADNAFWYCDPPYAKVGDNTYYGIKGKSHREFSHYDFFKYITEISRNNFVMISYEDSEFIRNLYQGWNFIEIPKKTVNFNPNNKRNETLKTNELLITNYPTEKGGD